nr:hypothetical protein [Tanacetum cinerariifolium]
MTDWYPEPRHLAWFDIKGIYKLLLVQVMAAPVISISLDVLVESVGSSFSRVILIGFISVKVSVALEVGAAVVASPTGVLELDTPSLSEADPLKSSSPPVSVALKIPATLILLAPSAIVAPSSEFPLTPVVSPLGIRRRRAILILPGEDIPIGRLYRTHPSGTCKALTSRKSVRPLPSYRLALRYTSHHMDHFTSGSSSSHSSSDHSSSRHSSSGLHGVARPISVGGLLYYVSIDDIRVVSWGFIGPFEILDRVGYKYHPLHVITYPLDQIRTDLSYVEEPEAIIDRQDRIMRKKTIPFIKILWRNHPEREATWETEESIRTSYPHFLP